MEGGNVCYELKNGEKHRHLIASVFMRVIVCIYALLWVITPEECIVKSLYCVKMLTLPVFNASFQSAG